MMKNKFLQNFEFIGLFKYKLNLNCTFLELISFSAFEMRSKRFFSKNDLKISKIYRPLKKPVGSFVKVIFKFLEFQGTEFVALKTIYLF